MRRHRVVALRPPATEVRPSPPASHPLFAAIAAPCRRFCTSAALLDGGHGPTALPSQTLADTIRAVLRRAGPLPLPHLSKQLDDATRELVAEHRGGLAGFVAASMAGAGGNGAPTCMMVALRGGIKVVFPAEYASSLRTSDQQLAMWVAALFVAHEYFPKNGFLPSSQPTTSQLHQIIQRNAPRSTTCNAACLSSVMAFENWLPSADPVLLVMGKRVMLGGKATRQEMQERTAAAARPWSKPVGGGATKALNVTASSLGAALSPASAEQRRAARRAVERQSYLARTIPATFFVPLSAVVSRTELDELFPSDTKGVMGVQERLREHVPPDFLDTRAFGSTTGPDDVYVRLLDATAAARVPETLPECRLAGRYGVCALGEVIVAELSRARAADPAAQRKQAQGVHMKELKDLLLPATFAKLQAFFSTATATGDTKNSGGGEGHQQQPSLEAERPFDPAVCILLFDRMRHVFDVQLGAGVVRPWAALPAHEQPSSLTRETTPLPWVLRQAESELRAETLSVGELFDKLPAVMQRQLLSTYAAAAWVAATDEELCGERAKEKGSRCLRGFLAQHSLYFTIRPDAAGADRVCSPSFLAASYGGVPGGGGGGGGGADKGPNGCWSRADELTESEKAEMLYHALPTDQAVAWTHFSNTAAVRALPFPAYGLRQEFFKRHFSSFRLYEAFANSTLIVGRADVPGPPADVLQPRLSSTDALLKHLVLHAVGGTTEAAVMQGLSKEGRAYAKQLGTFTALAEQLPRWFEVRKDKFNAGNSLITYIGPGAPTERDKREFWASAVPLRKVRNDASCWLPVSPGATATTGTNEEPAYDQWDPEWDEDQ